MILLIDNYDSFSYNLYQLIGSLYPDIRVIRNDACTVEEVKTMKPDALILSPGPGRPEDAGICIDLVKALRGTLPILGVCLGHQAICTAYGAYVTHAKMLMHGKQSQTLFNGNCPLFEGCPKIAPVARYHSLAVDEDTLPDQLTVAARTEDGEVMAVKDRDADVYGLQFHPESIMTPDGPQMLRNFLKLAGLNI